MQQSKLINYVLMLVFFSYLSAISEKQKSSLSVNSYTTNSLTISWTQENYETSTILIGDKEFTRVGFESCTYDNDPGQPAIPLRQFNIAVPQGAVVNWQISNIRSRELNNIVPEPVLFPGRDEHNQTYYNTEIQSPVTNLRQSDIIVVSESRQFRDMPMREVRFYPVSYDPGTRRMVMITSATITFTFSNMPLPGGGLAPRAKLDNMYRELILNYDQGESYAVRRVPSSLKKIAAYDQPWYRIEVTRDGLYRIDRSILSAAGINVSAIDPRNIRIYNNGGNPLSYSTADQANNPVGPVENAILVIGEENGRFDEGDYILFYGTQLGGWTPTGSAKDFAWQEHPYDTKNYYWLAIGDSPGRRMEKTTTPTGNPGLVESHFIQRKHFEEDRYNLLSSGNDWYGHRFYGLSGNASFNHQLDYNGGEQEPGRLRIKFKSGNAVRYDVPLKYSYRFTVSLNQQPVLINKSLGSRVSAVYESSFMAPPNLRNGQNTVAVDYTGNYEDCTAHLDWLEFYYPLALTAVNNSLMFFTNNLGNLTQFNLTGFTNTDINVFDISDPVNVRQLITDNALQGGNYTFNIDLTDQQHKRIMATSLSSSEIISVKGMTAYQPSVNLLDPAIGGDMVIITHPSFREYAGEIAQIRQSGRDPIKTVTVTTRDIYFFFSSGVQDVTAIRNFLRYAYENWQNPGLSYVMLFGDGHFDYRNISLADTNRVPPFEITADYEIDSRDTDNYYADINFTSSSLLSIMPDLAIGRMPAESALDARRMVDKLRAYEFERIRDGWQTVVTFVADDEKTSKSSSEWIHQRDTESLSQIYQLQKFIKRKIYLSAYNSVPGGFGRVKPEANQAIIDQVNEGTLIINYVGHGSPVEWAHEDVLNMTRDLHRIQNQGRLAFWIAATCDFGKYDDPHEPSLTEALIWEENTGAIGVVSSSRLVYSSSNYAFNKRFLENLFPAGGPSRRLGHTMLLATGTGANDQKYHLFGDPSMYLADPREHIDILSVEPDTLKALSRASIDGVVLNPNSEITNTTFNGGAIMIANDARFDSVNTGGSDYYDLTGPRIFKGEISVEDGHFQGRFIVPKSIRYKNKPSGRVTVFAWDDQTGFEALGYREDLLLNGTDENISDADGPEIDIYFKDQENFNSGDLVPKNVLMIAEVSDENGINLTEEVGHTVQIALNDGQPKNVTSFFAYDRDSYSDGRLEYHLEDLPPGEHSLTLQAWDNLNNPAKQTIAFRVASSNGLELTDVVNYPNPFAGETNFTFQAQPANDAALVEVTIKIYTVSGRLIRTIDGQYLQQPGYNYYPWDGRDTDGDILANGVYLYKIILKEGDVSKEVTEKLVILR